MDAFLHFFQANCLISNYFKYFKKRLKLDAKTAGNRKPNLRKILSKKRRLPIAFVRKIPYIFAGKLKVMPNLFKSALELMNEGVNPVTHSQVVGTGVADTDVADPSVATTPPGAKPDPKTTTTEVITAKQLNAIMFNEIGVNTYLIHINNILPREEYQIVEPLQLAHFFAQVAAETNALKFMVEGLNPQNPNPYRGRGFLQLTNSSKVLDRDRDNYSRYYQHLRIDMAAITPEREAQYLEVVEKSYNYVDSGCWYWRYGRDKPRYDGNVLAMQDDFLTIVDKIQSPGTPHYDKRLIYLKYAKLALGFPEADVEQNYETLRQQLVHLGKVPELQQNEEIFTPNFPNLNLFCDCL